MTRFAICTTDRPGKDRPRLGLRVTALVGYVIGLIVTLVLLASATPVFGQTSRYVATTGSDAGDCSSEASPCATITYAIGQADSSDTIEIADGTYTEAFEIEKPLTLNGESEEGTILQAHAQPEQATERVVTIDGDYDVAIVDVTIRHGVADESAYPGNSGGGIFVRYGSLDLSNVTLAANTASDGGALLYASATGTLEHVILNENYAARNGGGLLATLESSISILESSFVENTAEGQGLSIGGGGIASNLSTLTLNSVDFIENHAGFGGGMDSRESQIHVTDVLFSSNHAVDGGGGVEAWFSDFYLENVSFYGNTTDESAGGLDLVFSTGMLSNVTFGSNAAEVSGGGFVCYDSSVSLNEVRFDGNSVALSTGGGMEIHSFQSDSTTQTLTNVVFTENSAPASGGGLYIVGSSPSLTNVVFAHNSTTVLGHGGGIYILSSLYESAPTLTNVTLYGNEASASGGGIYNGDNSSLEIRNSIVWGNTSGAGGNEIYNRPTSTANLNYSLYSDDPGDIVPGGGFNAQNSLTANPLFVDEANGNLRLMDGSLAIDAGDPATPDSLFATDVNGDPIDLDGNPRFFNTVIDIGAYEFQGTIADEPSPEGVVEVLGAPTPNPAQGFTSLTLRVAETQHVTVEVFDALGRRVQTLYDDTLATSTVETLTLDASALPAGVYVVRAKGKGVVEARRITVVQ